MWALIVASMGAVGIRESVAKFIEGELSYVFFGFFDLEYSGGVWEEKVGMAQR